MDILDTALLALEVKLGHSLFIGFEGTQLTPHSIEIIKNCHIGGVILFSRNYLSAQQVRKLCLDLQETALNNPPHLPLVICLDQEGGRVNRFKEPFTHFPSASELGRMADPELIFQIGMAAAGELSAVGVNTNLAPVLDLRTNRLNKVIGDRSFSEKLEIVSMLGEAYVRGLKAGGVLSVAKHFPGHGDTVEDSHYLQPVSWQSENLLRKREMEPFRRAVLAGVDAIMTSHVLYPEVDLQCPATLSKYIIGEMLKKGCAFSGPVMSDDLLMAAISRSYSPVESSLLAYKAGIDILLICHGEDNGPAVYENLLKAARQGEIGEERIDEAMYNIWEMKKKMKWPVTGIADESSLSVIGCQKHKELASKARMNNE